MTTTLRYSDLSRISVRTALVRRRTAGKRKRCSIFSFVTPSAEILTPERLHARRSHWNRSACWRSGPCSSVNQLQGKRVKPDLNGDHVSVKSRNDLVANWPNPPKAQRRSGGRREKNVNVGVLLVVLFHVVELHVFSLPNPK